MSEGTILVVDDDQALREVMHDHVSSLGYRVTTAEDGPTALNEGGRPAPSRLGWWTILGLNQ